MEILQENISFLQEEVLAKNNIIKSLMETQTVALKAITNLKEKLQDQHELPNITYKQQIQQHQGQQNNQQRFQKNLKPEQNHYCQFQNQRQKEQQLQKEQDQAQKDGKQQQQEQQKLQHQTQ